MLAVVWADVLGMKQVSLGDNFFAIGGHSLLVVGLFARIKKLTGRNLPLSTLFNAPTIAQLAEVLDRDGPKA
jgi:aryl carrier-like protein